MAKLQHNGQYVTGRQFTLNFKQVSCGDVALVGGKNSSLGEMITALSSEGIKVPPGFATTSKAYWHYIDSNDIRCKVAAILEDWQQNKMGLSKAGSAIRRLFLSGTWPKEIADEIHDAYEELSAEAGVGELSVAVRSSATAEDLPEASFAGQQETYLNITGYQHLLDACRRCYASLFTDRAISYRQGRDVDHMSTALSIGVQQMVRSDKHGAGVMFSIDTESGFDKIVLINAAWGLGENVVQGTVNPDEYQVFKPLLNQEHLSPIIQKTTGDKNIKLIYGDEVTPTRSVPTSNVEAASFVLDDKEILQLARWACTIEKHYGCPMDMEWAKDGTTGNLFVVQARPETVHSRKGGIQTLKTYKVTGKGRCLVTGLSIGDSAVSGRVCALQSVDDIKQFVDGSILVTSATDPDWVPVMKRATAIITDHGGRTSHAAIVSRELGVPAIVGTGCATFILQNGRNITVSCAEGDCGYVYEGLANIESHSVDLSKLTETRAKIMLNLGDPAAAYRWWRLPIDGIGLARMEFVVTNAIQIHPMALVHFEKLLDPETQLRIARMTAHYAKKSEYFVDKLSHAFAAICASVYPKPAILRLSDFKTNEYANLIGGAQFEPKEENPMLGFRGASRYYSPRYKEGFALECQAIKRLREVLGFTNAIIMVPFCRTVKEAEKVLEVMAENGLRRGEHGLQVYVMCEIPSNVVLGAQFADFFDGFSIGSNDLTQLCLGVDRDSDELADLFDERDEAVMAMIKQAIQAAHSKGRKIGICGQAPSDYPEFAKFLVDSGIDSISVSPDSFVAVKKHVIATERGGADN
ncbi:hypothetical protein S40288_05166 [Stachybotrys chartarum IBT 40288]|nr:hypothetical protein S40288_05166 [Stachybotrys chartarum IBT 40288]